MKLWVGLGNPGRKYEGNRHNVGFLAVDRIAAAHGFGPWRSRFQGLASDGVLGGEKVLLLKPQTFMNLSGQSAGEAARFLKVPVEEVLVFHDEIDLAPGRLKVKQGGGHAGHNGLRSLHQHLGDGYARVRIGVGHPGHKDAVAGYVLHDFAKAEREGWLEDLLRGIEDGAEALARGDAGAFQTRVALRSQPPKPPKPAKAPGGAEGAAEAAAREPQGGPEAAPAEGPLSALRRLAERFR